MYNRTLLRGLLTAPYPFGFIGDGMTRGVTLALPAAQVRAWLPPGLELGPQNRTPAGTHPLIFLFHDFTHCQYSFPTLLQSMNFHEQTVGIPFTYLPAGNPVSGKLGPYYFMPKLYLDDLWVLLNGKYLWGFDKEMAAIAVTQDRYTVTSSGGESLVSLSWSCQGTNGHGGIREYPAFEPIREMLSQTLITLFPAAVGPFFTLTEFDRRWNLARLRPVETVLEVGPSYLPGLEPGRYLPSPALGSFELSAPWWLSLPYPPMLSSGTIIAHQGVV